MSEEPATGFVGCAAGTVSYLPRARVAAESWQRHHPQSPFVLLLVDGQDWPRETEPFQIVVPEDLGLTSEELATQRGIYDAYEMSGALRPHLLRMLLEWGARAIVFTDTDTCFYSAVDDLALAATMSGVVLSPHSTRPVHARQYFPSSQIEYGQRTNGLFNTGLLAVGPEGRDFLDWWAGWLARDSLREPSAGIWSDQLWVDWAPVYFEHVVVRDSSLNVAFWNLDERELHEVEGRAIVDGAPLRHFHFAGFDPRQPERLSTYLDEAWPPPPANPVLTRLLHEYAERLLESGSEELCERPYRYAVSAGGRPLELRERVIYREAVLAAEARGGDPPPNPFDPARIDEFERLVDDPASLRLLSPQARKRVERARPAGLSPSSLARIIRRLLPAARYALTERPPPSLETSARIASDAVRREY